MFHVGCATEIAQARVHAQYAAQNQQVPVEAPPAPPEPELAVPSKAEELVSEAQAQPDSALEELETLPDGDLDKLLKVAELRNLVRDTASLKDRSEKLALANKLGLTVADVEWKAPEVPTTPEPPTFKSKAKK